MPLSLRSLTFALAVSPLVVAPLAAQQRTADAAPDASAQSSATALRAAPVDAAAQPLAAAGDVARLDVISRSAPSVQPTESVDGPRDTRLGISDDTSRLVAGPRISTARIGIAPAVVPHTDAAKAAADAHMGAGENVALMVVGGAGLITGLIIGGGAGAAVAVTGAALGLWGLYNYVK